MASGARIPWCAVALGIASIVSGVRGFARGEAAEEAPGRAVFVAKGCALCHEERAVLQAPHVSALRKDRSLFELATGLWNHAPMMEARMHESGLPWPKFEGRDMNDLLAYIQSLAAEPNPNVPQSDEAARRGKLLFEGKAACTTCHPGPHFTDKKSYNVGVTSLNEPHAQYDTPSLIEAYRTAPYYHDGRAATLKEALMQPDPEHLHGNVKDLAPQEIEDLIAYVLSL